MNPQIDRPLLAVVSTAFFHCARVFGRDTRAAAHISFKYYLRVGVPITLLTLLFGVAWLSVALVRQRRSIAEKRRIVEETLAPGASVARVARAHGVNANQVFGWRRLYLPLQNAVLYAECDVVIDSPK